MSNDPASSIPPTSEDFRAGIHSCRRHVLLYARMLRAGARWIRKIYPESNVSQWDFARRKVYKARVARQIARDFKKMEGR